MKFHSYAGMQKELIVETLDYDKARHTLSLKLQNKSFMSGQKRKKFPLTLSRR